jgi:group I intron endonuclease
MAVASSRTFEVYRHTSPSGKSYVGWTSQGSETRWRHHVSQALRKVDACPAFHRAIRKYGPEAFTHEVLERLTTEAGAKRAEQLWIAEIGTVEGGYNISEGGDGSTGGGRVFTAEHRSKLSEARKGKRATAESRQKVSASLRAAHARGRHTIGDWARGNKRPGSRPDASTRLKERHAALSPEERSARASRAACAMWEKRRSRGNE